LLFSKQIAIYSCSWTFLGGKKRTSKGIPNVQKGKKQDLTPFFLHFKQLQHNNPYDSGNNEIINHGD